MVTRIASPLLLFLMIIAIFGCTLSSVAIADERRVIIGFHKKPHTIERALIRRNKGVVRRRFRTINALSASLTDRAITRLQNDPTVAYVEEDTAVQLVDAENFQYRISGCMGSWPYRSSICACRKYKRRRCQGCCA